MYALVATDPDDHGIRFVLTAETEDAIKEAGLAFILVRLQEHAAELLADDPEADGHLHLLQAISEMQSADSPLADRFAMACDLDADCHEIVWTLVGPESVNPQAQVSA